MLHCNTTLVFKEVYEEQWYGTAPYDILNYNIHTYSPVNKSILVVALF